MSSKIKNIIILGVIIGASILAYVFFIKKDTNEANLTSSSPVAVIETTSTSSVDTFVDTEFISILLSVRDIKLNDSVLSNTAFSNLHDSSIILTPDGNEGRKNPFAMIGFDATPISTQQPVQTPTTPTINPSTTSPTTSPKSSDLPKQTP